MSLKKLQFLIFSIFQQMEQFEIQNIGNFQMLPYIQHLIIPLEKDREMKQHIIIIFSEQIK